MTIMGPTTVRECPHCDQLVREDSYLTSTHMPALVWTDGYEEGPMASYETELVKCPTCSHVFWISDAKEVGDYDWLVAGDPEAFKRCNPEIWEDMLEDKDKLDYEISLHNNSLGTENPDESDYIAFADNNLLTQEQERYVRILAWRLANDDNRIYLGNILGENTLKYFTGQEAYTDYIENNTNEYSVIKNASFTSKQLDNINKLKQLLNERDPDQLFIKAELARETGDFEEASKILKFEYKGDSDQFNNKKEYYNYVNNNLKSSIDAIKYLVGQKIVCVADIRTVLKHIYD